MKKLNKTIAVFLTFAFALTFNPAQSRAEWDDKSDELPGMSNDGAVYVLAGVAVVGVGALIYVLVKKNKKKKATAEMIEYKINMQAVSWENQINQTNIGFNHSVSNLQNHQTNNNTKISTGNSLLQEVENASKTIPVNLIISPLSTTNNFSLNQSNGIQVGVRIRF